MRRKRSAEIVEQFWTAAWKSRNPEAVDRFAADGFVLSTGGVEVVASRESQHDD